MPRRIFRKFTIKRHQLAESRLLAPFRHMLHEPRYWGIRRRTVVPAFALGLFVAWLPFPGHPLFAGLGALALRINVPIATVTTFITNPLTMGPMYFSAYHLGQSLLGAPPQDVEFEMSLNWLTHHFVAIWQPMMLGCLLLGFATALLGYVIVDLLWRLSLRDYKLRKRAIRDESSRQSGD